MNFFEHQDEARRHTTQLLFLFVLAIAFMIATVYGAVVLGVLFSSDQPVWQPWQPELLFLCTLLILSVVGSGSLWKIHSLRQGGSVVATRLGGRLLSPTTHEPQEQLLLNVVEEMAIASGISVPAVYLLDQESGINAFAAGYSPNDAVIGVTQGCIEQLSREELQGVIAHEFSHILNGDMRLNIRLMGVLHGILIIYITGRVLLEWTGRGRGKERGIGVGLGLTLIAAGGMGLICGRLIKSAVSRQREFLADASAVQFTRNPLGISGALLKIGGFTQGSRVVSPCAEEASHLFFGAMGQGNFEWFATHPPLEERIRRLKACAGELNSLPASQTGSSQQRSPAGGAELVMGFQGSTGTPAETAEIQVKPDGILTSIGTTDPQHLAYARSLLQQLPDALREAIRQPETAMAIVYSLLLDPNPEVRDRQMVFLKQATPADIVEATARLSPCIEQLSPRTRLPLLDLTIPALRTLSAQQCAQFFHHIKGLIRTNGRLSLSEYVLQVVLQRRLQPYFKKTPPKSVEYTQLDSIWPDCIALLSALAQVGQTTPDAVVYALRSGVSRLPGASQRPLPTAPQAEGLYTIGQSLNRLEQAAPKLKQAIVDACAHTVLVDNKVTLQEAELLRAIVITLDCPIPPFLHANR